MNIDIFIQNVKKICKLRGTTPTAACSNSGAGKDLISDARRRGSIPSIERVQKLATYLGVSTSELLGEKKERLAFSIYEAPPQDTIEEAFDLVKMMSPVVLDSFQETTLPAIKKRTTGPYTMSLTASLQQVVEPGEDESGPSAVSDAEAALNEELVKTLCQLSPEETQRVRDFAQGVLASRPDDVRDFAQGLLASRADEASPHK